MRKLVNGITYSFNRNIGWQDRTLRSIIGIASIFGTVYYLETNLIYSIALGVLAIAQFGTVFSARCIICFFTSQCTIGAKEKGSLTNKEIKFEN